MFQGTPKRTFIDLFICELVDISVPFPLSFFYLRVHLFLHKICRRLGNVKINVPVRVDCSVG